MEIEFLHHYGFTSTAIKHLQSHHGRSLLPLQERVIREGRLFDGERLLICAPTSSGKTFLTETLFLHHALKGRNTILLLPSKALANQRYEEWKSQYSQFGFDILLSTRDHPFDDQRIVEGRFHLAIVIYEKLRSLMATNDAFIHSLGACIIDEIHYLYHPERGPDLELLITEMRRYANLQLLGLSAMVSDPDVAQWLGGRLIQDETRPVELRQGICCHGRFTYHEFNSHKQGIERYPSSKTSDEGEAMLEIAVYFAKKKESTLLFWPQKNHCYTAARKLAEQFKPKKPLEIPELEELEQTTMRSFLAEILPMRIGVHTGDLSISERRLVEQLAQRGDLLLVCATSTLAEGINFPVVNVLTTKRMYASLPQDVQKGRPPAPMPISQNQLCNMIGRAGRLGRLQNKAFGRGLVITCAEGDVEGLTSLYITSTPKHNQPILPSMPLDQLVLRSLGPRTSTTLEESLKFIKTSLSGSKNHLPDSLDQDVQQTLKNLDAMGFLAQDLERLHLTPLGKIVVKNGLSLISATYLETYVKTELQPLSESERHSLPPEIERLIQITLTMEIRDVYFYVSRNDTRSHRWPKALRSLIQNESTKCSDAIASLLASPERLRDAHHAAFKKALIMLQWIRGIGIQDLEKNFQTYAGAVKRLGEECGWIASCLLETAAAHALPEKMISTLEGFQRQLIHGLPLEWLGWADLLRERAVTRAQVLEVASMGYHSPDLIASQNKAVKRVLPPTLYRQLIQQNMVNSKTDDTNADQSIVIKLDRDRPDIAVINGLEVPLTPYMSVMLFCLAEHAETCVDHETIIKAVWTRYSGDRKKLQALKTKLVKKIQACTGIAPETLVTLSAGHGFILNAKVTWRN